MKRKVWNRLRFCLVWMLVTVICCSNMIMVRAEITLSASSAILIEASTGEVIYEVNSQERRSPASITKIMTLLLIFEQIGAGKLKTDDIITTSEHAQSMGGSQVYLETGETQTLDTMIKCIVVSSGNDASVAVAEHIAGTETAFVEMMNRKAAELGMKNTHFEDCCGLTDSENHYTSAEDIAIMSRELITKYPDIFNYTKIWMEDITHNTARGSSTFTLSSTNKLLKQYQWTTGLKTGFTSKAMYCISATAKKDNVELIAVVMGEPDSKTRSQDVITLFNYGFSVSSIFVDENKEALPFMSVKGGVKEQAELVYEGAFRYLDTEGNDLGQIEKVISIPEQVDAPVKSGEVAGEAIYRLKGEKIGSVPILFTEDVEKAGYKDYLKKILGRYAL